ncbi:hypothetical protein PF005_g3452 [Phytophthora fragariae]|uniref:CMP-sialic acid transporter 4 n=4 Tax=Phytophthora fragariae TaxID=53985 RepID=A0A6A3UNM1_9STRA|nr:hypothetical protein PF003_g28429 [Phytophthora fragariae]KAE8946362.1 hypothetical protein PF009_g4012 [Phytophthora fragariae]KAE9025615.1 hypothetical protein PF011_g2950 [Phytophthora fragariae]KAE9131970.1 hypothetical protein PF010_g3353 [Phytophthora fragariae]KAE9132518.1 hypothetical protein PF007_g3691 [Phytophthora fragariae]
MKVLRMLAGMLAVATLMCSGNLCISASKRDGQIPYSSTTVTLLIEVLKLAVMLTAIVFSGTPAPARLVPVEAFYYAVPSFLYAIDNNLNYVILRYMDAATLSVLWNLKIVVTAVLFRFVLKHPLSELRKVAIVLLVVGVLTSQSNHLRQMEESMTDTSSSSSGHSGMEMSEEAAAEKSAKDLIIGLLLVLVAVTISSCASVFTEWTFKRKSSCPFLWQNIQMYVFGIIFNAAGVLLVEGETICSKGFFHGYNSWTLAVVAVNSIGGIGMGFILKYLDNIACVYSHSMAMMLTMLFSMLFFSFSPSLEFGCGLTVLVISMYIYHHPLAHVHAAPPTESAIKSRRSSGPCSEKHSSTTIRITERSEKKRMTKLMQQENDDDTDDADTASTTSSNGGSLLSIAPRSMSGLQRKKSQYSMIPVDSEDLESARANAREMESSLNNDNNQTHK